MSAQDLITEWALCFFCSFGGVICCFFLLFSLELTVEIETSFQQTGAGRADQYYCNYD